MLGYTFGPLDNKKLELYYIQVHKGHDVFMISRKITRLYYVISGTGYFTIANRRYDVSPGCVVEAPPKVEYCYSGSMTLIGISAPRWFSGNDVFTRWNPDVLRGVAGPLADVGWLTRLLRVRMFGKSPTNAFLQLNRHLWNILPVSVEAITPVRLYAAFLNKVARMHQVKGQALSTLFLRNRPMLEVIGRLVAQKERAEALKVAVLGSSTGAEVYSVAWAVRSVRRDLRFKLSAVDVSQEAVAFGKRGVYSTTVPQLTNTKIFELMSEAEMGEMFDKGEEAMTVKAWIREGIEWHVGDVSESEVLDVLSPQDFVLANNFLCHMEPSEAERCLRNIARLVKPGGYLCVAGIDLDTRTRVANDLGWTPVQELLEEIHEGDPYMRGEWPCHYAGLEPLNKRRADWKSRYATVFQLNTAATAGRSIASIRIKDEALA